MKMLKVSIMGGSGYTGSELLRLLINHPYISIDQITSRQDEGKFVADVFPFLEGKIDQIFTHPEKVTFDHSDLVFFATPNGVAMRYAKNLLDQGKKIIDLAADFRIKDISLWEHWYQMKHECPELAQKAVYGLTEINRDQIKEAQLIANPGCYPTAIQLALVPLLKKDVINESSIIIDAKSGISGAGKRQDTNLLMSEAYDNFNAYSVGGHRHEPEIEENLKLTTGNNKIDTVFVPHLLPMVRGIYATVYADLKMDTNVELINKMYTDFYQSSYFVNFLGHDQVPQTKSVRGSNQCKISFFKRKNKLIILSTIDNLVKGAAGQAIQNMNVMFGIEENIGLDIIPVSP